MASPDQLNPTPEEQPIPDPAEAAAAPNSYDPNARASEPWEDLGGGHEDARLGQIPTHLEQYAPPIDHKKVGDWDRISDKPITNDQQAAVVTHTERALENLEIRDRHPLSDKDQRILTARMGDVKSRVVVRTPPHPPVQTKKRQSELSQRLEVDPTPIPTIGAIQRQKEAKESEPKT